MERFIYGSPAYEAHMQESTHERGEKEFLEAIAWEGMIAVDVGGNVGLAACAIAQAIGETGRLFCFEPVPEFREILTRNIQENGLTNIEVVPSAVGRRAGSTSLSVDGGSTSIVPKDGLSRVTAEVTSLDEFFGERGLDRLDLLNMDCEGSELLVLQGARRLLSRCRTEIFVEVHHGFLSALGHSVHKIVGLLKRFGYQVSTVSLGDLSLGREWKDCEYIYARPPEPQEVRSHVSGARHRGRPAGQGHRYGRRRSHRAR